MGGCQPIGEDADLRRIHFLAKMYAKMKEMDPVGGVYRAGGNPPPHGSANALMLNPLTELFIRLMSFISANILSNHAHFLFFGENGINSNH